MQSSKHGAAKVAREQDVSQSGMHPVEQGAVGAQASEHSDLQFERQMGRTRSACASSHCGMNSASQAVAQVWTASSGLMESLRLDSSALQDAKQISGVLLCSSSLQNPANAAPMRFAGHLGSQYASQ